jgi:hypothetical protein
LFGSTPSVEAVNEGEVHGVVSFEIRIVDSASDIVRKAIKTARRRVGAVGAFINTAHRPKVGQEQSPRNQNKWKWLVGKV